MHVSSYLHALNTLIDPSLCVVLVSTFFDCVPYLDG